MRFAVKRNKQGDWTAGILTVYGAADSAKSSADAIIDSRGIPYVFPEEVFAQAEALRKAGLSAKELEGREDLRALPLFTIDGRDAKDLDDARLSGADGGRLGAGGTHRGRVPLRAGGHPLGRGGAPAQARRSILPIGSSPCCPRR